MKQLDFMMRVKEIGTPDTSAWDEPCSELVSDDMTRDELAQQYVDTFNQRRNIRDAARVLVSVRDLEIADVEPLKPHHQWGKTSAVTQNGGYDLMACKVCGVTGKRYGLGQMGVRIDYKFRKYEYECPLTKVDIPVKK